MYRFTTRFNPYVMGALVLLKLTVRGRPRSVVIYRAGAYYYIIILLYYPSTLRRGGVEGGGAAVVPRGAARSAPGVTRVTLNRGESDLLRIR